MSGIQVTPYVGEIRMFPFQRAVTGWVPCDGRLLSINGNETLYALIGTTFGGNGQTDFGLPDLRGRVPLHQGQGIGLSPRVMGMIAGNETVNLNTTQMAQHSHPVYATTNAGSTQSPGTTVVTGALTSNDTMYASSISGAYSFNMATDAVTIQGGSNPHENTMPTLTIGYYIATYGIYPSQG